MLTYTDDPLTFSPRLAKAIKDVSPTIYTALLASGRKNGKGDFLDVSTKGHISYRPLNRIVEGEDPYAVKGRVSGKPSKVLKSFLGTTFQERPTVRAERVVGPLDEAPYPDNLPILWDEYRDYTINDTTWERFSNMFMAQNKEIDPDKIKIVTGEDIKKYYLDKNYTVTSRPAPLLSSCMRYDFCQPYLELYAKNPDVCSMMVELDDDNNVRARALIWKTEKGQVYMDRIYGDNKSVEFFRNYAIKQGWWYKYNNTYTAPCSVFANQKKSTRRMKVKLTHIPEFFPYMDTFAFLSKEDKVLSNSKASLKNTPDLYELRNTRGGTRALRRSLPPIRDNQDERERTEGYNQSGPTDADIENDPRLVEPTMQMTYTDIAQRTAEEIRPTIRWGTPPRVERVRQHPTTPPTFYTYHAQVGGTVSRPAFNYTIDEEAHMPRPVSGNVQMSREDTQRLLEEYERVARNHRPIIMRHEEPVIGYIGEDDDEI